MYFDTPSRLLCFRDGKLGVGKGFERIHYKWPKKGGKVTVISNQTIEDASAYIKGWLSVLKSNRKLLFACARQGKEAVEYIQRKGGGNRPYLSKM
ncbi:MAG: hypothetical protein JXB49_12650 [Bacteroidales bacterium]|nr:hypothetical protein [Bacteroidales bacterium]